MHNIVLAIHIILALLLIGSVLMQRSEGGGLGIGGGGNAKAASRGGLDGIGRATWFLAAGFMITSLTLTVMATRATGTSSIFDNLVSTPAASQAPETNTDNAVPALPSDQPSN